MVEFQVLLVCIKVGHILQIIHKLVTRLRPLYAGILNLLFSPFCIVIWFSSCMTFSVENLRWEIESSIFYGNWRM